MKTDANELQELISSTRQKAFEDVIELVSKTQWPDGMIDMQASELVKMIRGIDDKEDEEEPPKDEREIVEGMFQRFGVLKGWEKDISGKTFLIWLKWNDGTITATDKVEVLRYWKGTDEVKAMNRIISSNAIVQKIGRRVVK